MDVSENKRRVKKKTEWKEMNTDAKERLMLRFGKW